jgi:hypothetical protein
MVHKTIELLVNPDSASLSKEAKSIPKETIKEKVIAVIDLLEGLEALIKKPLHKFIFSLSIRIAKALLK